MSKKVLYKNEVSTLELIGIKVEKTYRNLLCGLPTKDINRKILSDEIKNISSFSESENIFYIEPIQTEIHLETEYKLGKPYKLPYFVYMAKIVCYSSGNLMDFMNSDSHYFEFGLLWFFDELSIEIPESIIEYAIEKSKINSH
jgi:hypothetical protein